MNFLIEIIYGTLAFASFIISIVFFKSASDYRGTKLSDKAANIQMILGILTILSGAQIILSSMHQIGSIFLVTSTVILIFENSKTN